MARTNTAQAATKTETKRKISKVQFWIPRLADDDVRAHKQHHQSDWWDIYKWGPWLINTNGQHRSRTPVGDVQFHGGIFETDNPHHVRALLKDPIARCRKADIVLAGIYTIEDLQQMGALSAPGETEQVVAICKEAGIDPHTKTEAARKMSLVALVPLPDFDVMTEDAIVKWALDDTPEGRVSRGAAVIQLQPGWSREEMKNRIRAELTLRGDPRVQ